MSLTYGLALELGKYGITCNAVAPIALTRGTQASVPRSKLLLEQGLISEEHHHKLFNRPGPEFVPPIVVYLVSEYGASISGKVFHSEGGKLSIFSVPIEKRSIYKDMKDGPWTTTELIKLVPEIILTE